MSWLLHIYAQRGVLFDRIFGAQAADHGQQAHCRQPFTLGSRSQDQAHNVLDGAVMLWGCLCSSTRQRLTDAGWEAKEQKPAAFWASLPDGLKPVLSWYNVHVDVGANSPFNPLSMIR